MVVGFLGGVLVVDVYSVEFGVFDAIFDGPLATVSAEWSGNVGVWGKETYHTSINRIFTHANKVAETPTQRFASNVKVNRRRCGLAEAEHLDDGAPGG